MQLDKTIFNPHALPCVVPISEKLNEENCDLHSNALERKSPAVIVSSAENMTFFKNEEHNLQEKETSDNEKSQHLAWPSDNLSDTTDLRSTSSASSRWKLATNVVMANIAFQRAAKDNPEDLPRQMSKIRMVVPVFSLHLAIFLFVCNCLIAGLGTILSGICFSFTGTLPGHSIRTVRVKKKTLSVMGINFAVGVAQFFTVTFFFVGWFWSVAWGVCMWNQAKEAEVTVKQDNIGEKA